MPSRVIRIFFFSITLIWASEANNALSRQIVQYIDFFADDYCEIRFHEILHVFRILEKHYAFGGNIFRQICTYNSAGSHYVNSLWRLGTVCSRLLSRFYIETNTDKEKKLRNLSQYSGEIEFVFVKKVYYLVYHIMSIIL